MSQYPSPYYPPNVQPPYMPYGPQADVLAPAKRASLLMFIVGPLLLLCGGCFVSMPFLISTLPADQTGPMLEKVQAAYHQPPDLVFPVVGSLFLLPGIVMLVLAFFVRRGGRVPTILSAVLVGAILLLSIMGLLAGVGHLGDADVAGSMCMQVLSLAIFGTLFLWLVQAARASSSVQQAQQQYLAQYWQYQQNMQTYSGYGYAAPPQEGQGYPPPQTPPPPPAQAPPPSLAPGDDSSPPPSAGG